MTDVATDTNTDTNRITKVAVLKAPIARVWQALTDHEQFGTWFKVRLDQPFAPGQPSSGRMTYPGLEHVRWNCIVQRMDAPHLFSYTWHPYAVDPDVDYSGEPQTLVEFRLSEVEGGTRLVITESGFDALPPHRQPDALRMNTKGWTIQMENIKAHVGA